MKEIIVISPEFALKEGNEWGGLGVFTKHLINSIISGERYVIKILTIGFKDEPLREKYSGNIEIIRVFSVEEEKISWWKKTYGRSKIGKYEDFKKFTFQVYIDLKKNRKEEKEQICIFNDCLSFYYLNKVKELGYRIISVFLSIPTQSVWEIYVKTGKNTNLPAPIKFFIAFIKFLHLPLRLFVWFLRFIFKIKLNKFLPSDLDFTFLSEFRGLCYSDRVVVLSAGMKNYFLRHYSIKSNKIEVIHWGLDGDFLKPSNNLIIENIKQKYDIADDDVILLSAGRIHIQKGFEYAIGALKLIEDECLFSNKIKYIICGGNDADNRSDGEYLQQLKEAAGFLKKIRVYFPGFVSGEEKLAYFDIADIFLLPSVFEPFGFVLLEAMARKTAIVASNTDGPLSIIKPAFGEVVDFNLPSKRCSKFACAVKRIMSKKLPEMKQQAFDRAVKRYDWGSFVEEIDKIIENITA
ncbi:MAG: glycosyltransferase [bacterium]|nr:glycosyltransferase [bacterium]